VNLIAIKIPIVLFICKLRIRHWNAAVAELRGGGLATDKIKKIGKHNPVNFTTFKTGCLLKTHPRGSMNFS
jgi:hypothetical protein